MGRAGDTGLECFGFTCIKGKITSCTAPPPTPADVRCNPRSGVECVTAGNVCPEVDGGPDASHEHPDARPHDAGKDAEVPDATALDAGRDATAPDAH